MKERFFRNRTAVFTVVFVLLVGLVGILAPVIAPNDPYETNILNKFASYSLQYPLGTDQLGRCVLSRMIYGIRPTLGLALLTMFGTISLGAILGIMAAACSITLPCWPTTPGIWQALPACRRRKSRRCSTAAGTAFPGRCSPNGATTRRTIRISAGPTSSRPLPSPSTGPSGVGTTLAFPSPFR